MSNAVSELANKTKLGNQPAKAVLSHLAYRAKDWGYSWPSNSEIAQVTEVNERTVRRVLKIFDDLGLVTKTEPKEDQHRRGLQINMDMLGMDLRREFMAMFEAVVGKKKDVTAATIPVTAATIPVTAATIPVTAATYIGRTIIEPSCEPTCEPTLSLALVPLNKKTKRSKNEPWKVPDWFNAEISAAWDAFEEHRRLKKNELTNYARDLLVKKLLTFQSNGMDPTEVINRSIEGGWTGLFPVRDNQPGAFNGQNTRIEKIASSSESAVVIANGMAVPAFLRSGGDEAGYTTRPFLEGTYPSPMG